MTQLVKYDAACRALAEARSVDEVKDVRDVAMAMKLYAKQAKNRNLEADAFDLRVRAERKLGEMIVSQKETVGLNVGGRPKTGTSEEPVSKPGTLAEAGIDKKLSARAQKLNAIPPAKFEEMVKEGREEVQRAAERRTIKAVEIAQARASYESTAENGGTVDDLHALIAAGKRFPVILADPPWEFVTYSGKGKQRSAERYYDTMSLDVIKALPVGELAADDCALFLWSVCPEVPGALEVIRAWGFEFKTKAFAWIKLNNVNRSNDLFTGMGHWTRANSEDCWLATRGNPLRLAADVHQVVMAPVGDHSVKPFEVHTRIERLLAGPYLEMFARKERSGWTTFGNEIPPPPSTDEIPHAAEDEVPRCHCGVTAEYGYHNDAGGMDWFCADHRLRQFSSDARRSA